MIQHSRFVPFQVDAEAMLATERSVRAHLSAVASPDDDEDRYVDDVEIRFETHENGILITGSLDREPDAPYLRDGFDPYAGVPDELRAEAP